MAQSTDISYRQLAWCTTWYYAKRHWGGFYYPGQLPSQTALQSGMGLWDPVILGWPAVSCVRQESSRPGVPTDPGYGQGLTFYSWTSDQLSNTAPTRNHHGTGCTYVLDAILGNETELAILEHTTDTAGATEIIFALFDLLGLRFTPRLRDIGSRRLYRSGRST